MSDSKETLTYVKMWYVLRDLKRSNAKLPAYKLLGEELKMEVFTPMKEKLVIRNGKRIKCEVPFVSDLLFVHDTFEHIDSVVKRTETLQFRYRRGGGQHQPMVVPDWDMERFIQAVKTSEKPKYFLPGELTPQMCGRRIRVMGGPMNGFEGTLLTIRGSKVRRLLVELPGFFAVGIEVTPEYIYFLE